MNLNRCRISIALTFMALGLIVSVQPAQAESAAPSTEAVVKAADLPDIDEMRPFSAETGYLSLQGELRYLTYQHTGIWLSHQQAGLALREDAQAAER